MKNILDKAEAGKNLFAEKSYQYFFFSLSLFIVAAGTSLLLSVEYAAGMIPGLIIGFAVIALSYTSAVGLYNGIMSIRRKESDQMKKYIGCFGNGLFFLFFLSIILANMMDLRIFLS